jgi:hypothetical protein
VRGLYLRSSLKEAVNYSPAKRFSEIHSPLREVSNVEVYADSFQPHFTCRVDCSNDNPKMYNITCLILNGTIFYIASNNSNPRVGRHFNHMIQ